MTTKPTARTPRPKPNKPKRNEHDDVADTADTDTADAKENAQPTALKEHHGCNHIVNLTLSAILAVICTPCGLFLGLVPMKADLVTAKQSKASQMVSFIVAIVFIGLLVAGHDLETWAMVIGLVIGFAVAKIPALHPPGLCTSGRSSNPRKWLPPPSASRKPGRSKLCALPIR